MNEMDKKVKDLTLAERQEVIDELLRRLEKAPTTAAPARATRKKINSADLWELGKRVRKHMNSDDRVLTRTAS